MASFGRQVPPLPFKVLGVPLPEAIAHLFDGERTRANGGRHRVVAARSRSAMRPGLHSTAPAPLSRPPTRFPRVESLRFSCTHPPPPSAPRTPDRHKHIKCEKARTRTSHAPPKDGTLKEGEMDATHQQVVSQGPSWLRMHRTGAPSLFLQKGVNSDTPALQCAPCTQPDALGKVSLIPHHPNGETPLRMCPESF